MLNNIEVRFSVTFIGKEFRILSLRVRPAAEICSLCKIQILQLLVRTPGLFQKPANDMRGLNGLTTSRLAHV
jgi:hypothetical protein